MKRIQRILVGLDLGPHSAGVWREACAVARAFQAELTLLHAVPGADPLTFGAVANSLEARLAEVTRDRPAEVQLAQPPVIVPGPAAEALLTHGRDMPADLVLIGAGTRTRHDVVVLGSTAERVVREAEGPVWVVRPGRAHLRFDHVLAALDPVTPQDEVVRAAGQVAAPFHARLTVLTVVDRPGVAPDATRERALDAVGAGGAPAAEAEVDVRQGPKAAAEILDAVLSEGIDLLVMGESGDRTLTRLLEGNTVEKVLRVAPCSILRVAPVR